jgi:hypothetical protein
MDSMNAATWFAQQSFTSADRGSITPNYIPASDNQTPTEFWNSEENRWYTRQGRYICPSSRVNDARPPWREA